MCLRIRAALTALALAVGALTVASASAAADPISHPTTSALSAAAALPASPCTLSGTVRTCELWARSGTLPLPAGSTPASVPVWGYAASATGPAEVPGPLLLATVGETVRVVVHNLLTVPTSLLLPEQNLPPDTTGAAPGEDVTYEFVAARPGTFTYEAGLTAGGPRQVAMGLAGALVVGPATPGTGYGTPETGYDDEAVVVLQGIDPAFNAAPATFEMSKYRPRFWLINGRAFPDTGAVATGAGRRLLLRFVNVGLEDHAMSLVGIHQTVVAADGNPLAHAYTVLSENIAAGSTVDTIVAVPAGLAPGTRLALYDAGRHLDNAGHVTDGVTDFGGMLTFLTVGP